MQGRVVTIFVAPVKGQPMQEVVQVEASKENGLAGDRYGKGQGSWSTPGTTHRQVSLIALEAIRAANAQFSTPILPIETRRNILTQGVDLNSFIGKEFSIGEVRLRGTKLCDPCERPSLLAGRSIEERQLFPIAFCNQGGLCAEVVEGGVIRSNDLIIPCE